MRARECGGTAICEHGRRRSKCKERKAKNAKQPKGAPQLHNNIHHLSKPQEKGTLIPSCSRSGGFDVADDEDGEGGAGFTCASTRRDPGPQGRWPCLDTSSGMNATQQRHLNLDALDAADGSMGLKQPLPLLKDDFPGLSPSIGGVAMGASPPASARQPDP